MSSLGEAPINPPSYMPEIFGDAVEETEEESYDVVEGIGDLGNAVWGGAAMLKTDNLLDRST